MHLDQEEVALVGVGCVHVAVDLFELTLEGAWAEDVINHIIFQEIKKRDIKKKIKTNTNNKPKDENRRRVERLRDLHFLTTGNNFKIIISDWD